MVTGTTTSLNGNDNTNSEHNVPLLPSTKYSCTSCQVTFHDGQQQRAHMKDPWQYVLGATACFCSATNITTACATSNDALNLFLLSRSRFSKQPHSRKRPQWAGVLQIPTIGKLNLTTPAKRTSQMKGPNSRFLLSRVFSATTRLPVMTQASPPIWNTWLPSTDCSSKTRRR